MASLVGIVRKLIGGSDITISPGIGQGDVNVSVNRSGLDGRYGFSHWDAIVDAAGNGTHTDIEAAIDGGATSIFILDGTYTLSGAINVDSNGIFIIGESQDGVIIDGNNGAFDVFTITTPSGGKGGTYVTYSISNLTIKDVTSRFAITIDNTSTLPVQVNISNITFFNVDAGVATTGGSNDITTRISDCYFDLGPSGNIDAKISLLGGATSKTFISNNFFDLDGSSEIGIRVGVIGVPSRSGGDVFIEDNIFSVFDATGVYTQSISNATKISGNQFSMTGNGRALNLETTAKVVDNVMVQSGTNGTSGAAILSLGNGTAITSNTIFGDFFQGITVQGNKFRIVGNEINGPDNDGIDLTNSSADNNVVMGNYIGNCGAYGIDIGATSTGNLILGNIFESNSTGNFNNGAGASTEIGNNVEV